MNNTVLLVEDEENDVILIQHAFQEAGVRQPVHAVGNHAEAIRYLSGQGDYANRDRYPLPSLVLLDLRMRGGDGFNVLRWLQERPALRRQLAVVILSGVESSKEIETAYALGANCYLFKPLGFRELVALTGRVRDYWLELNRLPEHIKNL